MSSVTFFTLSFFALLVEAFFSGSEMALISADRIKLKRLAEDGNSGAKRALMLLRHPEKILATTLVGTSLSIAFQGVIVTLYVHRQWGAEYEVYASFLMSPVVMLLGEVLPKTIFQSYAELIASRISVFVETARLVLSPLTWVLGKYTTKLSRSLEPLEDFITGKHHTTHRDELRYLLTHGQKETTLKSSERRMIRKILEFSKADVKKAFIPLVNVDMVENTMNLEEALQAFKKFGHSRLPVYEERVDNVIGVLHVFDVFSEKDKKKLVSSVMQQAFYVPKTQQLDDLMFTMQKRAFQMAIVVDEYGGAVGAVTLEDILEEIVGDIKDEYDEESDLYREISSGVYLINTRIEIDVLNEKLKTNITKGAFETLAGFLLQQFGRIPEVGDELHYQGMKFVVRKATPRSVELVQMGFIGE